MINNRASRRGLENIRNKLVRLCRMSVHHHSLEENDPHVLTCLVGVRCGALRDDTGAFEGAVEAREELGCSIKERAGPFLHS